MKQIIISLVIISGVAFAQGPIAWIDNLVNTEEHMVHQEKIGPYVLNVDGQRLLKDPYLNLSIKHKGKAIPADSVVRVETTLFQPGTPFKKTYFPTSNGEGFLIDKLELDSAKEWSWDQGGWLRMEVFIDGPAGEASGQTGIDIFPPKPETGNLFRLINFSIPLVLLGLFAIIYKFANVPLRRQVTA